MAQWLELHPAQPRTPWADELTQLADNALDAVSGHLVNRFGEAQLAHRLPELLPENGQLFLGNSLIVRLIDALTRLPAGYPVFSNRGASGIDGLISTSAGVQRATAKPTLAVVGDLSALYDLNALALLRQCSAPTVLIVVNNNGGQIFHCCQRRKKTGSASTACRRTWSSAMPQRCSNSLTPARKTGDSCCRRWNRVAPQRCHAD